MHTNNKIECNKGVMIKNEKLQILQQTGSSNTWTEFTVDHISVLDTIIQRLKLARDSMPKDKNEGYRRNIRFEESEHIKSDINIVKQINKDVYNVVNDLPYFIAKETKEEEDEFLIPQANDKLELSNDLFEKGELKNTTNKNGIDAHNETKHKKSCMPVTINKYQKNDKKYDITKYHQFVDSITQTNFRFRVEKSIFFRKTKRKQKIYKFFALRKRGIKKIQKIPEKILKLQAIKLEIKNLTFEEKNEYKSKSSYKQKKTHKDDTEKDAIKKTKLDKKESIEEIYETFEIKKNVDLTKYGLSPAKKNPTKKY